MTDVENLLRRDFVKVIEAVHPAPRSLVEQGAAMRLEKLANAAPTVLLQLAEPWSKEILSGGKSLETVRLCARIHMYARVLDDALDENLPCHRKALLRIQPDFWNCAYRLGALYSELAGECVGLILETVTAVLADDNAPSPQAWGAKNHHLLICPLLLGGEDFFSSCRGPLSDAILILQAVDELRQDVFAERLTVYADLVKSFANSGGSDFLFENGWHSLADNCLSKCQNILNTL